MTAALGLQALRKQVRDADMATWRVYLTEAMGEHGETWSDVESCTLSAEQMDREFSAGFGSSEGEPFTLWTAKRVYFPAVYDGSEWVESVSRHPDGEPTMHVGGQ